MSKLAAAAALFVLSVFAQQSTKKQFDVATIKPSPRDSKGINFGFSEDGKFGARNAPLMTLMARAYDVQEFQISGGPSWIRTDGWDIAAQAEGLQNVSQLDELRPMIQALLVDRFQLRVHRATREMPTYVLVRASGGSKLQANSGLPGPQINVRVGEIRAIKLPVSGLIGNLSRVLERPVVDQTGLTGEYDFTLTWAPDGSVAVPGTDVRDRPSIFTAVQEQLGLKLNASKGPVEVLVLDGVERPSAN